MQFEIRYYNDNQYLYGATTNNLINNKVAGFDLNSTLISTKSRKIVPIDENDWKFTFPTVPDILKKYKDKGYNIVIFTNQNGRDEGELNTLKKRIEYFSNAIKGIDFVIFIAFDKNICRKPYPTFMKILQPDLHSSFYCGDTAGRVNDHDAVDYKFALNSGVKFYTPEYIFMNELTNTPPLLVLPTKNHASFVYKKSNTDPEIIIMVGLPASGKSYISKQISEEYGHTILSLDILKTKSKFQKSLSNAIQERKNIIIDNTNVDIKNRKTFIDLGLINNYTVKCIWICTSLKECQHNNHYRFYKFNGKFIPNVVYNTLLKKFQEPTLLEGFHKLIKSAGFYTNDSDYELYF